jgi:CDP-6-deoxy-D-xylo-4-hexulose-3-dehydrase
MKHVMTTNSGSSANLLAFTALTAKELKERRLMPGDEVITVAAGFPTTINPIIMNGCIPVFVDIDIGTYEANIDQVRQAISPKTKAIMMAHTLGNVFDLAEIRNICDEHHLWLIEDTCDALGAKYDGKFAGTFGDIATLSFYPAHHMTMGEGGALLTNNNILAKVIKSYRDWGRDCWCGTGQDNSCNNRYGWQVGELPKGFDHKYTYSRIGYNLKITDMQAALGVAQIEKLEGFITKRNTNWNYLMKRFQEE